jgi:protein phosphatase 1 regulatory subunit 7
MPLKGTSMMIERDNLTKCLRFLRTLDLSFNKIKHVSHLSHLRKLTELYLVSNKISSVDGLQELTQLTNLELGANRIRVGRIWDAASSLSYKRTN